MAAPVTPRASFAERNQTMCRLYHEGKTLQEIGDQFHISRERVRQILRHLNVLKMERPVMKGTRTQFLGVSVTEEDKAALRAEADKRGVSMSALTSDLIHDMLVTED